jgi:alkylhydroperoxidase/carboxymuconolactone decarboxylase family protein YurZ
MLSPEEQLRRLAGNDTAFIQDEIAGPPRGVATEPLCERTRALVRIAALVALDAPPPAYRDPVRDSLAAGASIEELVDVLTSIAPSVGVARVVVAAPRVAAAAGVDVDPAVAS